MSLDAFRAVAASGRPALAFIVHGWGGGIRRHVDDLGALAQAQANVLLIEPAGGSVVRLRTRDSGAAAWFTLPRELALLASVLRWLNTARLHFHHVQGMPAQILQLPAASGLPYDVTLHDYLAICPQLHLVTRAGTYCGEPAEPGCAACLADRPPPWPADIVAWRAMFAELLRAASRVIAPSHDVATRILRYVPGLDIGVWPHPETPVTLPPMRRIATLGMLPAEKGLEVVAACALDAEARGLPLSFRIIGAVGAPLPPLPSYRLSMTGEYADAHLASLVAAESPDAIWLPAQVPETYAYTLSVALASGLPVVASDLGALGERLRGHSAARLLRWDATPGEWNAALLDMALAPQPRPGTFDATPVADYAAAYLAPLAGFTPRHDLQPPSLDAANMQAPAGLHAADAPLAELFVAGVACGKAEARAELGRRVARADIDFAALNAALRHAHSETAQARERVDEIESSTTWRMSEPLRHAAHRAKATLARARSEWHGIGHLPRRTALAMTLLRQEGPRALGARVLTKLKGGARFRPRQRISYELASSIVPLAFTPGGHPRVSIVIPVYGKPLLTFTCLASVHAHTSGIDYEVIVVDDASPEPIADALAPVTGIRIERNPANLGFIGSSNRGAALARGDMLVLLNNDTIVTDGWLDALLQVFERHPDAGLAGAKLIYPDGRLQEAGGIVWRDASAWNVGRDDDPDRPEYNYLREADYCSGACLVMPIALFRSLGGFDVRYAPAYYEDTDLAFAVRAAGRKVFYQPAATVVHFEGQSSGTDPGSGVKRHQATNRSVFRDKWSDVLRSHRSNGIEPQLERDRRALRRMLYIDACMLTPDQDSGSVRTRAMLELAVQVGTKVTFVADNLEHREPYAGDLQQRGVEVVFHPYVRSVSDLLVERGREFDIVVIARHYIAIKHLDNVRRYAPQALVAFDTIDLHFLREERLAALENSDAGTAVSSRRDEELALIRRADVTIVVSSAERDVLRGLVPDAHVLLLTNIHEPMPEGKPFAAREGLVFIGGFQHPPNTDAVLWYAREVLPLVRKRLPRVPTYIVGSKVPSTLRALAAPDFVVTGYVPDVTPFFTGCRVSISPLRYGAGVKGKVNQAMSYGLPVVATSPSVEGMHLRAGEDVLVADSADAFAQAIETLYRDEALWRQLAANGRENIRRHFSRQVASAALAELFELARARSKLPATRAGTRDRKPGDPA